MFVPRAPPPRGWGKCFYPPMLCNFSCRFQKCIVYGGSYAANMRYRRGGAKSEHNFCPIQFCRPIVYSEFTFQAEIFDGNWSKSLSIVYSRILIHKIAFEMVFFQNLFVCFVCFFKITLSLPSWVDTKFNAITVLSGRSRLALSLRSQDIADK